jgi:hypothetical protein
MTIHPKYDLSIKQSGYELLFFSNSEVIPKQNIQGISKSLFHKVLSEQEIQQFIKAHTFQVKKDVKGDLSILVSVKARGVGKCCQSLRKVFCGCLKKPQPFEAIRIIENNDDDMRIIENNDDDMRIIENNDDDMRINEILTVISPHLPLRSDPNILKLLVQQLQQEDPPLATEAKIFKHSLLFLFQIFDLHISSQKREEIKEKSKVPFSTFMNHAVDFFSSTAMTIEEEQSSKEMLDFLNDEYICDAYVRLLKEDLIGNGLEIRAIEKLFGCRILLKSWDGWINSAGVDSEPLQDDIRIKQMGPSLFAPADAEGNSVRNVDTLFLSIQKEAWRLRSHQTVPLLAISLCDLRHEIAHFIDQNQKKEIPFQLLFFMRTQIDRLPVQMQQYLQTRTKPIIAPPPKNSIDCSPFDMQEFLGYIEEGEKIAKKAEGKDLVFFLGNTGAGKSSIINYLHGCNFEKIDKGHKKVYEVSKESEIEALVKIGHNSESETFFPRVVTDERFTYCDCPGFLETRGLSIDLANAINTTRTLCAAKSIHIVLLIDYKTLGGDRAQGIRQCIRLMTDLFGSEEKIQHYQKAIAIGVTQVPPGEIDSGLGNSLQAIKAGLEEVKDPTLNTLLPNLFIFHLQDEIFLNGGISRDELTGMIENMPVIDQPENIFTPPLNDNSMNYLSQFTDTIEQTIDYCIRNGCYEDLKRELYLLESLQILKNQKLVRAYERIRKKIDTFIEDHAHSFHRYFKEGIYHRAKESFTAIEKLGKENKDSFPKIYEIHKHLIDQIEQKLEEKRLETAQHIQQKDLYKAAISLSSLQYVGKLFASKSLETIYSSLQQLTREQMEEWSENGVKEIAKKLLTLGEIERINFLTLGKKSSEQLPKIVNAYASHHLVFNLAKIMHHQSGIEGKKLLNRFFDFPVPLDLWKHIPLSFLVTSFCQIVDDLCKASKEAFDQAQFAQAQKGINQCRQLKIHYDENRYLELALLELEREGERKVTSANQKWMELVYVMKVTLEQRDFSLLEKKISLWTGEEEKEWLSKETKFLEFAADFSKAIYTNGMKDCSNQLFNDVEKQKDLLHLLKLDPWIDKDGAIAEYIEKLSKELSQHHQAYCGQLQSRYEGAMASLEIGNFSHVVEILKLFCDEAARKQNPDCDQYKNKLLQSIQNKLECLCTEMEKKCQEKHVIDVKNLYRTQVLPAKEMLQPYIGSISNLSSFIERVESSLKKTKESAKQDLQYLETQIRTFLEKEDFASISKQLSKMDCLTQKYSPAQKSMEQVRYQIKQKLADIKKNLDDYIKDGKMERISYFLHLLELATTHLSAYNIQVEIDPILKQIENKVRQFASDAQIEIEDFMKDSHYSLPTLERGFPSLTSLHEAHRLDQKIPLESLTKDVVEFAIRSIEQVGNKIQKEEKYSSYAQNLMKIKVLCDKMGSFKEFPRGNETRLIKKVLDQQQQKEDFFYYVGQRLLDYKKERILERFVTEIIDEYPQFSQVSLELFNKKTSSINFSKPEDAIGRFRSLSPDSTIPDLLLQSIQKYHEEYNQHIQRIFQDPGKSLSDNQQVIIQRANQLKKEIADSDPLERIEQHREKLCQLLGCIFAQFTLSNLENTPHLTQNSLYSPHIMQILTILKLLALDREEPIADHLIQVGTGEGKSIVLGGLAAFLAYLGYDVTVACYNSYLSDRDEELFAPFFSSLKIKNGIHYHNFGSLANQLIGKFIGNTREITKQFLEKKPFSHLLPQEKKKSILLIDEVDLFFSPLFYGNTYRPVFHLQGEEEFQLIQHIWQEIKLESPVTLKSVQLTSFYKTIVGKYENSFSNILDHGIEEMISDAQVVSQGKHKYVYKDKEIGYHNDRGEISYSTYEGYKTIFAYLLEYEKRDIDCKTLQDQLGIKIDCGAFSYAEIPFFFSHKLGVTGTLESLTANEKSIVEGVYDFHKQTIAGSAFVKNEIKNTSLILLDDPLAHIELIREKTIETINQFRAVIIVFESPEKLRAFKENETVMHDLKQVCPVIHTIEEETSKNDRNYFIKQSTVHGQITLITRAFGRGSDFICRDSVTAKNGGVHIIQAFYSETETEETQIRGRTGRQDDRGEYSQILCLTDLSILNSKLPKTDDYAKAGIKINDIENYLKEKRKQSLQKDLQSKKEKVLIAKKEHEEMKQFVEDVKQNHLQSAMRRLEQFNGV